MDLNNSQNKQTPPHLDHLDEFKSLLEHYQPSPESLELFTKVQLVIMVGPTAAGRNTLINILTKTGRYHMIVSDTTRPPRLDNGKLEQDGVFYWFKTEEAVLSGIKNGEYIEARLIHNQQISGANIAEIRKAYEHHVIALKEIEINGAVDYKRYKPDLLCIFLLPPSFDVWMERLRGRGAITPEELRRRLISAQTEITQALSLDFFQFIINYEIHEAAEAVDALANGRHFNDVKQQEGRDHAEQLLIDVRLFLGS